MVSFTPKLHLLGYALAFSGSLAHTRLMSSKTPSFLKPANTVYQAEISELKQEGKAHTQHKPAINKHDIKKLYDSGLFNLTQPETLQNKVFFEIMFFFRRRGRQNLSELKKEDFSICTDSSGVRFVCKAKRVKDELAKNWRENNEAFLSSTVVWKICLSS